MSTRPTGPSTSAGPAGADPLGSGARPDQPLSRRPDAIGIAPAATDADLDDARVLFTRYAESLPIDLGYQGFAAELKALPGAYAPPGGALLLARGQGGIPLGCAALRPFEGETCEMKRLYVTEAARGLGAGRALVAAILAEARRLGYGAMVLDTLPSMAAALALYAAAGFRTIPAYYPTPIAETVFLRIDLAPA